MKEQLENRLQLLQEEYQKGQERLSALEEETASLKTTMLRISGAIQVLQELKEGEKKNSNLETITGNGKIENG